jgi:hypothetical protein
MRAQSREQNLSLRYAFLTLASPIVDCSTACRTRQVVSPAVLCDVEKLQRANGVDDKCYRQLLSAACGNGNSLFQRRKIANRFCKSETPSQLHAKSSGNPCDFLLESRPRCCQRLGYSFRETSPRGSLHNNSLDLHPTGLNILPTCTR